MSQQKIILSEEEYLERIQVLEEEILFLKEQLMAQQMMLADAIEYINSFEQRLMDGDLNINNSGSN